MVSATKLARSGCVLGALALLAAGVSGCSASAPKADGPVTISFMAAGNDTTALKFTNALATAFHKANPKITVKVDSRPGGPDGNNLVKTRLSTGTMDDVFIYNSGSLLQALGPDQALQPLTNQPWVKDLTKDFKTTVSTSHGVYGAPVGTTFDGGILYNKKVYAKLGLSVPDSWSQFISNSQKIKATGITPVLESFGTPNTAQMFVLADFANVSAKDSKWAGDYTKNKAKYTNPPALEGFTHTAQIHDLGLMNKDYASLTGVNALTELANGQGAQYPAIANSIANVLQTSPEKVDDIGYFPMPSDSGHSQATVWEPSAAYIPKTTTGAKLAAAEKLVAFIDSPAGCTIQNSIAGTVAGPYAISTCKLPSKIPGLVKDEQKYLAAGKTGLALEFLSPIKGPNLAKILVQVGSGISSPASGASLYDNDVKAQAQQLGLPGWG